MTAAADELELAQAEVRDMKRAVATLRTELEKNRDAAAPPKRRAAGRLRSIAASLRDRSGCARPACGQRPTTGSTLSCALSYVSTLFYVDTTFATHSALGKTRFIERLR